MATKFFDPEQVVCYFAGARIQGWADGEMISYSRDTDGFQDVIGTDGEVARSKSNDKRSKVVLKLLQTSSSNLFLSGVHNTDLNAPNGAGVGSFLMQDLQGNTVVQGAQAWIVKFPEGSMDRTAKSREWTIRIAETNQVEGGNP